MVSQYKNKAALGLLIALAWVWSGFSAAPPLLKVAFYNVENLFDTIDNPATEDDDFTPLGANRWKSERYSNKIANLARVIDDLDADIVGLAEVENEAVIRDLVSAINIDYTYIFLPTRDSRGVSQALLYRGSQFFPETISQITGAGLSREVLVVSGLIGEREVIFMVCHQPSPQNSAKYRFAGARSLTKEIMWLVEHNPASAIVVMGDFNATPDSKIGQEICGVLENPFKSLAANGYGSYIWRGRRYMYDYILISGNITTLNSGIFAREYMFKKDAAGYPWRSFERGQHVGGFSDHLPVYMTIDL